MASQENKADLIGGVNIQAGDPHLKRALFDMSTTAQINDSLRLGGAMLQRNGEESGRLHKARRGAGRLRGTEGALTSRACWWRPRSSAIRTKRRKLRSEAHQEALADALMKGIQAYFRAQSTTCEEPTGVVRHRFWPCRRDVHRTSRPCGPDTTQPGSGATPATRFTAEVIRS
jgi:hypothetical protein